MLGDPSAFDKVFYVAWGMSWMAVGMTGPTSVRAILRADRLRKPAYYSLALTWIIVGAMISLSPWLYGRTPFVGICGGIMFAQLILYAGLRELWTRCGQHDELFEGAPHIQPGASIVAVAISIGILLVLGAIGGIALNAAPGYASTVRLWVACTFGTATLLTSAVMCGLARYWRNAASKSASEPVIPLQSTCVRVTIHRPSTRR